MRTLVNMGAIRARIERLANQQALRACNGVHAHMKVSVIDVEAGDVAPQWPEADAPHRCVCGADIHYEHVVHQLYPSGGDASARKG